MKESSFAISNSRCYNNSISSFATTPDDHQTYSGAFFAFQV